MCVFVCLGVCACVCVLLHVHTHYEDDFWFLLFCTITCHKEEIRVLVQNCTHKHTQTHMHAHTDKQFEIPLIYFSAGDKLFCDDKLIKSGVGSLFFASLGKNSYKTFQHFVIQVVWKYTRLLLLSLLNSDLRKWRSWRTLFSQSWVISGSTCCYWWFYKGRCTFTSHLLM